MIFALEDDVDHSGATDLLGGDTSEVDILGLDEVSDDSEAGVSQKPCKSTAAQRFGRGKRTIGALMANAALEEAL
eukprot:8863107-Karenia_brevis.AAC.1